MVLQGRDLIVVQTKIVSELMTNLSLWTSVIWGCTEVSMDIGHSYRNAASRRNLVEANSQAPIHGHSGPGDWLQLSASLAVTSRNSCC